MRYGSGRLRCDASGYRGRPPNGGIASCVAYFQNVRVRLGPGRCKQAQGYVRCLARLLPTAGVAQANRGL